MRVLKPLGMVLLCALLFVPACGPSRAELIARYIAGRLLTALKTHENFVPEVLRIEVEEAPGQSATVELKNV